MSMSSSAASTAVLTSSINTFTSSATASTTIIASTPTTTNSSPTVTATISPGSVKYPYYGCWNETTNINGTAGRRALDGGTMEGLDSMSVLTCLAFCSTGNYNFAGLEYGRECWCAQYLSAFATQLPDRECDFPCSGNPGEICGGSLKLAIYQKGANTGSRAAVSQNLPTRLFIVGLALLAVIIELS